MIRSFCNNHYFTYAFAHTFWIWPEVLEYNDSWTQADTWTPTILASNKDLMVKQHTQPQPLTHQSRAGKQKQNYTSFHSNETLVHTNQNKNSVIKMNYEKENFQCNIRYHPNITQTFTTMICFNETKMKHCITPTSGLGHPHPSMKHIASNN
jgi:hypothetical protein